MKDVNDGKFYVLAKLDFLYRNNRRGFIINFLLDTGATTSMISWNDSNDMYIDVKNLIQNKNGFIGIVGGSINNFNLTTYQLKFASDIGWYYHPITNIPIGDSHTTDGIKCPKISSIIGMDIISQFKFSTDGNFAYLFK
jgi:hypothetical protein